MSESSGFSKEQVLGWGAVFVVLLFITRGQWGPIVFPPLTPTPTPILPTATPTITPIPGFVAGEEDLAYASFAKYYAENCRNSVVGVATDHVYYGTWMIDTSYKGRGVYVGDAIWRFHIRESHEERILTDGKATQERSKQETSITTNSYPDGTWDVCPYAEYFPFISFEDAEQRWWEKEEREYKRQEEEQNFGPP